MPEWAVLANGPRVKTKIRISGFPESTFEFVAPHVYRATMHGLPILDAASTRTETEADEREAAARAAGGDGVSFVFAQLTDRKEPVFDVAAIEADVSLLESLVSHCVEGATPGQAGVVTPIRTPSFSSPDCLCDESVRHPRARRLYWGSHDVADLF